jgi:anti-sigma regulatory factor (Ser/Thr protein kinase)
MHVSLARRLQRRTSQLTRALDAAEKDERDPARLAWLFGLDHLVTLMGRTTDSLLVLGGHGPGSSRGTAVPIHDVLRGAAGRVEDYARVNLGTVDADLAVTGHAADELVLLLAELMDNAAIHSQDEVVVHAWRLADRVVVQVIDDGIGMDERRRRTLNERLASPVVDVAAISRMGLTVVGLLAAHHGLHVELRANRPRGTIAEVVLPGALLRETVPAAPPAGATVPAIGLHRARPHAITGVPVPRPRAGQAAEADPLGARAAGESTEELPVLRTRHDLPVRQPRAHVFPDRRTDRGWRAHRDPRRLADGISAYARGVDRARSRSSRSEPSAPPRSLRRDPPRDVQNRPWWTDDQGA